MHAITTARPQAVAVLVGCLQVRHRLCLQVEFCEYDLTGLKEYHQRYKICEFHLKIHSVVREGKRQRFCQQCGRFHVLGEFDGDKRSCRARLQRHNARRRKKTETDAASKAFGSNKKVRKPLLASTRLPEQQQQQPFGKPHLDHAVVVLPVRGALALPESSCML